MQRFLVRKLLVLILMALAISALVFFSIRLSPVDPISYLADPDSAISKDKLDELRAALGLNDPIIIQYFRWLFEVLRGNFGYSLMTGQPIANILAQRVPATLELAGLTFFLSTVIGVGVGLFSAIKPGRIFDSISRIVAVISIAVPEFFFGIILIQLFAYQLGWLNPGGRELPGDATFWDRAPNVILPVATLAFGLVGALIRYTRNSALDVVNKDYIRTARSKGVRESQVYIGHVFRNSVGPVLVILVFRIPLLIGGSVIVEALFQWPGMGSLIVSSITSSDYPVVMITSMFVAVAILVASFMLDIFKALADPRVRME